MTRNRGTILAKHALLLVAGALLGGWFGRPLTGLAVALAAALGWHLYYLVRFYAWIHEDDFSRIPLGSGIWPNVFARVQHFRNRNRYNKGRYQKLAERWRRATDALPDAAVLLNDAFEIEQYNSLAQSMLGLRGDTDRGQPIVNLIRHPDFVSMIERRSFPGPVRLPAPQDPDRFVSCRVLRFGLRQYLLLIRDISERIAAERMRSDFVTNASHELRTPLTVILGYLDALREDGALPEAWRGPIREMTNNADRMTAIVDDMLRLSELEAAPVAVGMEPVPVDDLIESVVRDAKALDADGPEIRVAIRSKKAVLGDGKELRSVISNLVTNALRFTPANGRVEVTWLTGQEGGELVVSDTGIGISPEEIPRITERFFRTDEGRARHSGGTGLGLAIVKHVLARHDATLEIESEPGAGSTFRCRFPVERLRDA